MNCKQKSGVFLNISCKNTVENTCTNCKKQVCNTHSYKSNANVLCEDCYWENYFYTTENIRKKNTDTDVFIATTTTSNTVSNTTNETSTPAGFEDGFGGGEFGGGGASSSWTEGDMESLNASETENGGLLSNDDTFFYS